MTPHLTIAWGAMLAEAEAAVVRTLPLCGRVREAVLFRQAGPQRWEVRARFRFREA